MAPVRLNIRIKIDTAAVVTGWGTDIGILR